MQLLLNFHSSKPKVLENIRSNFSEKLFLEQTYERVVSLIHWPYNLNQIVDYSIIQARLQEKFNEILLEMEE